jgi:outer membrane protein assembly factor BamB
MIRLFICLLLLAANSQLFAQLDPTPKGFKLLWKIPAYSCFSRLEVIRQTDSGAAFINARTMSCETSQSIGEIGIWVDSKGNAVYMSPRRGPDNQDIIYFSEDRIVFADGSGPGTIGGSVNNTLKITEVIRSGANATTNVSSFGESAFVPNLYYEPANPKDRIILNLASNQQWSPFRWLYAYTVDSGAGSGGETGSGLSQYIKIKNDPVDQYSIFGGSVDLKVDVISSIPVMYQWQKDGKDISGAATSNLKVERVSNLNTGVYALIVKSAFGSVTSSPSKIAMVALPVVSIGTNNFVGRVGEQMTVTPVIVSEGPTYYQWYKDGFPIIGENKSVLSISKLAITDSGKYTLECKNLAGTGKLLPVSIIANSQPGTVKWTSENVPGLSFSSPAVGKNGDVFFATSGQYFEPLFGVVYCINGKTGLKKWEQRFPEPISYSIAISQNGSVYVATWNWLHSLNKDTGNVIWSLKFDEGNSITTSPSIDSNGNIYVAGSLKQNDEYVGVLRKINGLTGAIIEEKKLISSAWRSSLAISADGYVYLDGGIKVTALSENLGETIWQHEKTQNAVSTPQLSIGVGGSVYCSDGDNLLALNGKSGKVVWKYISSEKIETSVTTASDGVVYFGSGNKLISLDGRTGLKLFEKELGSRNMVSAPTIGVDNIAYCASSDGVIYAVDLKNRLVIFQYKTDAIIESSLSLGDDGSLFFAKFSLSGIFAYRSQLFSLDIPSLALAKSTWPKIFSNNQNTCRVSEGFSSLSINYSSQSGLNLDIPVSPDFDTILEYSTNLNQWSEQQRFGRQSNTPSIVVPLKMDQTKPMEYWRTRNQ